MQFDLAKISEEIELQGLNQLILAERARLSRSWVSKVLRRAERPTAKAVKKMADVLGLDMRDLAIPEKRNGKRR